MPARSRQAKPRAAAQPEEEEGPYNIPNLDFNEPLSWRAGRAIPVADLLSRLQTLSTELRNAEQGSVDVKDIANLANDLVNANLLGHKDKGIRAWTVSCVVDILNLTAPNAPYKNPQLRDIFTVIVNTILPALADPSNAYNAQHQYILDQLVDTQSIVLIADIQDNEQLLSQLFSVCFDIVSGSAKNASGVDLAQSVVFQIGVALNTVVDEANLPQEVIDIIISQFLRVDPRTNQQEPSKKKKAADIKDKSQSTLLLKDYPPAYHLAKSVCTTCSEKMSGAIGNYFSSIMTNATAAVADNDDGKMKSFRPPLDQDSDSEDDSHESLNDLRKVHRLVRELWRACPDVLNGVVQQLEFELAADSASLRQLAVETLGDLVAGVGLAGLPDLPLLDPAAFPLPTIEHDNFVPLSNNPLLTPSSPKPFIHVHPHTYQVWLGRRIDKAVPVRTAWATAASRILLTRAGGIGLNDDEQKVLVSGYAHILKDIDDKVRLLALHNLETFPYWSVVEILGSDGGLSQPTSLLSAIAERVTDRKRDVREQAMMLLGNMWGVASRDIAGRHDRVLTVLGQAPSRLLSAMFVKDPHINAWVSRTLYECMLPLTYPPTKSKNSEGDKNEDPDFLRVQRLLTLVRDLDVKAKMVFFGVQKRQAEMSKAIGMFLQACEKYNGGVADDPTEEKRLEEQLGRFIESLSRQMPDTSRTSSDLWKFAKAHDRRNYQLIRFTIGAENDFRTMMKAMKELNKRLSGAGMNPVLETLTPILYQCALISYNRSHIPAIMEYAKSDDIGFAETAQEVLREISEKVPEVMKTHIQELCKELQEAAPSEKEAESLTAVDSLKACAAFAKRFPDEVPKDRKFVVAMMNFVLYSTSPKAAKHAASIVLTTSDKQEFHAKEILTKAIRRYDSEAKNKLAQLSAIAQVCLHSPTAANAEDDQILNIAITNTLLKNQSPRSEAYEPNAWDEDIDEETAAKQLALKILVNRCRSGDENSKESFDTLAISVMDILVEIIRKDGEYAPTQDTPSTQRNHLRLTAGRSVIKLCRYKLRCEELVTPEMFMDVAWMIMNRPHAVRRGLIHSLKKYLTTTKLNSRWITPLFLTAYEPDTVLFTSTVAWLRSRTAFHARQQKQARVAGDKKTPVQNVIETQFARLLSLLVYHPDYPSKDDPAYEADLLDLSKFIIHYLQSCANEENLSLIFHIAQRTKQAADAISKSDKVDERLYTLSDLAQTTIRNYADQMPGSAKGANLLQTWPGKAHLPASLFKPINGHAKAQEIVSKNYLPEEVAGELEQVVRKWVKVVKQGGNPNVRKAVTAGGDKKRKSSVSIDLDDDEVASARKSAKKSRTKKASTALPIRKTPNPKKRKSEAVMSVEQPSRKSARTSTAKKVAYNESDEDEDDAEDTENIVPYKPAPMEKYKHKQKKAETPDIEEEGEEEEVEEEQEEAGSPTPHGKDVEGEEAASDVEEEHEIESGAEPGEDEEVAESEAQAEEEPDIVEPPEPQDVEMTNGHDEQTNGMVEEDEEMVEGNEEAEAADTAEEEVEDENEEGAEEEVEEEAEPDPEPVPSPPRNKRASRGKAAVLPKTTGAPDPKPKTKAAAAKEKKAKGKSPAQKKAAAQTTSSPAAEPARRSTRRTRA
ncbi:Sister chromatid cohesion protein pds5 [Knufia fluminis]|uniref:Sister chromatid cohesion protein pds5 n=1 Tax=Knufia fluminis TaxID=191047 RepID=A0AAN8F6S9_9EURO|nr:Sister chromatid cohesion protein pds5 [Knufia fluminis]